MSAATPTGASVSSRRIAGRSASAVITIIEQHQMGELAFEKRYGIDLRELAELFARRSPHRQKLRGDGSR